MPHIQVGKRTKDLIDNPDFSEWTMEELLGAKRSRKGTRSGPLPKVVPMARIHEINRRLFSQDFIEMAAKVEDIRKYLLQVALGEVTPDKDRIDVAKWIYERIFGKTPVTIDLQNSEPSEYEASGVTKAVIIRDVIDVKAIEAGPDLDSSCLAVGDDDEPIQPGSPDDPFA